MIQISKSESEEQLRLEFNAGPKLAGGEGMEKDHLIVLESSIFQVLAEHRLCGIQATINDGHEQAFVCARGL